MKDWGNPVNTVLKTILNTVEVDGGDNDVDDDVES